MSQKNGLKPFNKCILLSSPTVHMDEYADVKEAYTALANGTAGALVSHFEQRCADYLGTDAAIALSSGREAIHLALKLAGVKAGNRVFCSDLAPAAAVAPIRQEGAVPVFVDSERDTWNMNPDALAHAVELFPDVRICLLTHLYGTPAKLDEIKRICDDHHIKLIENASDSLGATYHGSPVGSYGKLAAVSFGTNKIITGSAGGALLGEKDLLEQEKPQLKTGEEKFDEALGCPNRMPPMVAGAVCAQWPRLNQYLERKKAIYLRYQQGLQGQPVTLQPHLPDSQPSHWLTCLLIDKTAMKRETSEDEMRAEPQPGLTNPDELIQGLAELNVEARRIWKPLHSLPAFKGCPFVTAASTPAWAITPANTDPASLDIYTRGICLPSDVKITMKQVDRICSAIRRCFDISLF